MLERLIAVDETILPKLAAKKGFLGPIGDDLPSLIPLIFALMMFFYVFTFSWNAFDSKYSAFNTATDIIRVGNNLKGNNYLTGFEAFHSRCEEAKSIQRVNFLGGIVSLGTGTDTAFEGVDVENLNFIQDDAGNKFECTNSDTGPDIMNRYTIVRFFPTAIEYKNSNTGTFYVRPALLVVVAWE